MFEKPTYKELEQRVKKLEKESIIRQRAEEALSESEATLRSIFRAAPSGIGLVCDRVIKQANERLCEMTGYSQEELVGKNARILYPSDAEFEYVGREKYAQISKQGTGAVETHWQCKDGKVIDVFLSSTPIDPYDWSSGVTFTALDITERKKTEKALNESEARYRALFENMIDGVAVYEAKDNGEDFIFVDINEAGETISSVSKSKIIGKSVLEMFPGVKDLGLFEVFQEVWRIGKSVRHPLRLYKDDRISRWVENVVYKLPSGEIAAVHSDETQRRQAEESLKQAHDELEIRVQKRTAELAKINEQLKREIEVRKQTEKALRESEERFRSLVEQAADPIIAHDLNGQIIFVNEQSIQNSGYTKNELLSMKAWEIVPEILNESHKDKYWKKLSPNQPIMIEVLSRRKDGSVFPTEVHLVQIVLKGEKIIIAFGRDITERKQTEEVLRKREAELEIQSQHLQEVNAALKVLLKQRDDDRKEFQENIVANVKELVAPYLDKLSQGKLDERQKSYIDLVQANLNDIISPFIGNLSSKYLKLTPSEIQVASLIKHGKTTKDIAELLNLSVETIKFHRKNIRSKIGIKNKKINLRTCLASMQDRGGK